ncbi:putative uncharacterized protein C5orf58 homolog [Terrapene carolina triunguis]|uniref:putative uncharacterized protein C5orf58 homolog n=1 Tax=Terrapene triunguis TaxID=2587831 RepID=UPI001156C2D2|nr:putative uncharacterized protein C5orf58 homolog [Terrapene carolina triunguis]
MKIQLTMLLQRSPLSLVNDVYMITNPPACRNKKLDKTSMFKLCLKKMKSQLLLCDLTLNFSHPVKTTVSREVEEKKTDFEELHNSIRFHADASINNSSL